MIGIEFQVEEAAWFDRLPDIERLLEAAAAAVEADGTADILLTTDEAVRRLNARFLGKDKPTNVLSFPAPPNPFGQLGDVALALGVCEREAREQGKPLADHVRHLLVHGLLHLLGYDHQVDAEAEAMESLERSVLARLGVPDPYDAGQDRPAHVR
jgi:probable rRNA maturation factor